MKKWVLLCAFVGLAILASACGGQLPNGKFTIPLTLQEEDMYRVLKNVEWAIAGTAPEKMVLSQIVNLDFREPNVIHVDGKHILPDGSKVDGSYDLTFTAPNNALKIQMTALNVPGLDANSVAVRRFNEELVKAFADVETQANIGGVSTVSVKGGEIKTLTIVIASK